LNQKLKEQILSNKNNNTINYITSFKKAVNKNIKKLLDNKKHADSTKRNDIIFRRIKLNEFNLKIFKQKKERKNKIKCEINNIIKKEIKTLDVNKSIRHNSFQHKTKSNIINLAKK
jgi:hypothetical protein